MRAWNLKRTGKPAALLHIRKGKPLPVGWTIERADGGRAFGTTLGHFHRNFGLVPFRRMLVNGIIWSAGLEVPAKGAPCKLDKDDPLFPKSFSGYILPVYSILNQRLWLLMQRWFLYQRNLTDLHKVQNYNKVGR